MATYNSYASLANCYLHYNDEVIFSWNGNRYRYITMENHLHNTNGDNALIFTVLGIDKKSFVFDVLGYADGGEFPVCRSKFDLTKLTLSIFNYTETRTKASHFMPISSFRMKLTSHTQASRVIDFLKRNIPDIIIRPLGDQYLYFCNDSTQHVIILNEIDHRMHHFPIMEFKEFENKYLQKAFDRFHIKNELDRISPHFRQERIVGMRVWEDDHGCRLPKIKLSKRELDELDELLDSTSNKQVDTKNPNKSKFNIKNLIEYEIKRQTSAVARDERISGNRVSSGTRKAAIKSGYFINGKSSKGIY